MDMEEDFKNALNKWKNHISKNNYHSFAGPYLDCDAYRELVSMGPEILPLIREEYSKEQEFNDPGQWWCYLIQEIVPDFKIKIGEKDSSSPVEKVSPGMIGVDIDKVREYVLKWLDEKMEKYF